ncbi:MAG: hypothetical protein HY985_07865 [Magnetospirillum sp.]|nr:hypothetical protein [Magnetospirillum sp.]
MPENKSVLIGGKPIPIDLNDLRVAGVQALSTVDGPVHFDFAYRDVRVAGRYNESGGNTAVLKVVADLGPMPFTAESPHARTTLAQIVDHANALLGPILKVVQGRILLGSEVAIAAPASATQLVTAFARVLIPAVPYLDLVSLVVRPPLAAARPGESALRPQWRRAAGPR